MDYKNDKFNQFLIFLSIFSLLIFFVSLVFLISRMNEVLGRDNQDLSEIEITSPLEQQTSDDLPSIGYELRPNATDYQLELFDKLIHAHQSFYEEDSTRNLEEYASVIVRNFIADFFTLSNKHSRSDVGGLQFFSDEVVDDFRNFAIDDFYLYLNLHLDNFEHETLPTVNSTTILDVRFEPRIVEIDEEDLDEIDADTLVYDYMGELIGREIMTIVIDAQWTYATSTLWQIEHFQTSASFVLISYEDEVRIYVIEQIPVEDDQYGENSIYN